MKKSPKTGSNPPQDTIIEMLEGMEIQTPNSKFHIVKNGQFETSFGPSKLSNMSISFLAALFKTAREPDPIRDIIETANSGGRYFAGQQVDNSLIVRETRGYLIMEKLQNGLPIDAFVIGIWNIYSSRWEQKASSEKAQEWLSKEDEEPI